MTESTIHTASRTVEASASTIFGLLARPERHHEFDASGMVGRTRTPGPLGSTGDVFTMEMTWTGNDVTEEYLTDNLVTVLAADEQIGWRTAPAGLPPLGWEWRYLLKPVDVGTTRVTLTYDWTGTFAENVDRYGVPAFSESELANSLELLAQRATRLNSFMPEIRLRLPTETDARFLTDVVIEATRHQDRFAADFDEQSFRGRFQQWTFEQIAGADPHNVVSVIELDGRPAGRLRVLRTADSIELAGIQLRPQYQSSGVGSSIIDGLKAEAMAADRSLMLSVEKDNPRARSLYQRLGFVQTGESDSEYLMRWEQSPTGAPVNPAE